MYHQHSFCSFCGQRFPEGQRWPRVCVACRSTTYRNPLPVAIVLVPVDDGLLVVRRAAPPRQGQLVLPGGFVEIHETWQQAAARELHEEAGIIIASETITDYGARSTPDGYLLIFGLAAPIRGTHLPPFRPNSEASARLVITGPAEMAFPLHTETVQRFFERR